MPSVEQIVRPSVVPGIRPSNFAVPRSQPLTPTANTIMWGSAGDDVFALQANISQSIQPIKGDETSRTFDIVQVSDPDNPDNKVTVEAMTQYQAMNSINGSRITLNFNRVQPSQDVQIIGSGSR